MEKDHGPVAAGSFPTIHLRRISMQTTTVGLFVGLLLGLALVLTGFGEMLVVALFGIIGYIVGRVLTGNLDLSQILGAQRRPPS
jgi:hypothetical protein